MQNWDWLMKEADLYDLHLIAREVFCLFRLEEHNVDDMRRLLALYKPTKFFHIQWIEYKIKALRYHPVLEFGLRILAKGPVTYYRGDNIGKGYFDGDMAIESDGIETYESFNYNRKSSTYFFPLQYNNRWAKITRMLGTDVMWLYSNKYTSIFPYLERIFHSSKQFVLDHIILPNVLQYLVMEYINWTNYKDLNWILQDVISVWV